MADIPDKEPKEITAGDTVKWTKTLSDYKASASWVLAYVVIGQKGRYEITTTVSGDDHAVAITAATTAVWAAGDYSVRGYVTKTGEQYTVYDGKLKVKPNLVTATGLYDDRSDAQKAYDNSMTIWQNVKMHGSYSIAGRTYTSRHMTEIIALVDRCKADLTREIIRDKFAKTGINPRHIRVRFNR